MSASITFSIAGPEAEEFKKEIQEMALSRGLSVSEWITAVIAKHLSHEQRT